MCAWTTCKKSLCFWLWDGDPLRLGWAWKGRGAEETVEEDRGGGGGRRGGQVGTGGDRTVGSRGEAGRREGQGGAGRNTGGRQGGCWGDERGVGGGAACLIYTVV